MKIGSIVVCIDNKRLKGVELDTPYDVYDVTMKGTVVAVHSDLGPLTIQNDAIKLVGLDSTDGFDGMTWDAGFNVVHFREIELPPDLVSEITTEAVA